MASSESSLTCMSIGSMIATSAATLSRMMMVEVFMTQPPLS